MSKSNELKFGYKKCTRCGASLPATTDYFYKNKKTKDMLNSWCIKCHKDYYKANKKRISTRNGIRKEALKNKSKNETIRRYGLTTTKFDEILQKQAYKCAICMNVFHKAPQVDHNHKNGKLRGLLCSNCNRGLGMFKDNIQFLANAISYLDKCRDEYE